MQRRLVVPQAVRERTEEAFRVCGRGRRECMVFWAAAVTEPRRVVRAVHPRHGSTVASTHMDGAETWRVNCELYENRETLVVQLHTHPGAAFHSGTDDEFPIVQTPGFLSVVVPQFGVHGLQGLLGCAAYILEGNGHWRALAERDLRELLEWAP